MCPGGWGQNSRVHFHFLVEGSTESRDNDECVHTVREGALNGDTAGCHSQATIHVHAHMYLRVLGLGAWMCIVSVALTIVIDSYPSSHGWVVTSSAMSHCIHQQLPRWHSETLSVVTLLQPLGHNVCQTIVRSLGFSLRTSPNAVEEVQG